MKNRIGFFKIIVAIVAIVVILVAIYAMWEIKLTRIFSVHAIRGYIDASGNYAAVIFILIFVIRTFLIFFPYTVMVVLGGRIFGSLMGFIYSVIASYISASVAFYIARTVGRGFIQKFLGDKVKDLDSKIGMHGFKVIFAMRISAIFHFDVLSYGAGLTKVRYRDFIFGTMLGILPEVFALNYLGHNLVNFRSKKFILATVLFVIVAGVPFVYKRLKKEK